VPLLADVVRQHRYEHARTLLETACQEAAQVRDSLPVLQRFLDSCPLLVMSGEAWYLPYFYTEETRTAIP
jgi:hypothetical protein